MKERKEIAVIRPGQRVRPCTRQPSRVAMIYDHCDTRLKVVPETIGYVVECKDGHKDSEHVWVLVNFLGEHAGLCLAWSEHLTVDVSEDR